MLYHIPRTEALFGFRYVREQFLPKEKRRFGTYVLPIVWGERLIGRIDPRVDRTERTLVLQAVHAEPGAPAGREVADALQRAVEELATFVGVDRVVYPAKLPPEWSRLGA